MKNLFILLFSFITIIGYSQVQLNYPGDTVKYGRITHYFEPVKIKTSNILQTMDSVKNARIHILDSLEDERTLRAFTIYYKEDSNYLTTDFSSEFDPTDEFLLKNGIITKDSVISENVYAKQVIDSLLSLRKKMNKPEIEFDQALLYDWIYDSKIYLLNNNKAPLMIFDNERDENCQCYQTIVEQILSVKSYKRKILSKRTKSIYISILSTNKDIFIKGVKYKSMYVYLRFDNGWRYKYSTLVLY